MNLIHLGLAVVGGILAVAGAKLQNETLISLGATVLGGVIGNASPHMRKPKV